MQSLRICIIGDSNSTPHQISDKVLWDIKEMFWFPLCELNHKIIPISFVRNNIKRVLEMSDFFIKNSNSDVFIIQLGINDLTKTIVTKNTFVDEIYKRVGYTQFGKFLINLFYKRQQNKVDSSIFEDDLNNLVNYIKKSNNIKKFIFLSIPYGNKEKNSIIIQFNSVIEKISLENNGVFLNYFYKQQQDSTLVSDDLHYSKKLHKLISKNLIEILEKL